MFTNTACCTVWEKTLNGRNQTYIRHVTGAVYWEDQVGENTDGENRSPRHHALIIIHTSQIGDYLPKADDRILRGSSADLMPPKGALTVADVKDFQFGSDAVQHIEVTAK